MYYGHSSIQCSQPYAVLNTVDLDRLRELVVNYSNIDGNKLVKQTHTHSVKIWVNTQGICSDSAKVISIIYSVVKLSVYSCLHFTVGLRVKSTTAANDLKILQHSVLYVLNISLHDQSG